MDYEFDYALNSFLAMLSCSRRDCRTAASVIMEGRSLCCYHAHEMYKKRDGPMLIQMSGTPENGGTIGIFNVG